MTALLEAKQKMKRFFGNYEFIFMPILKFVVAFLLFRWINANMGYLQRLNTPYVTVVLGLVCAIMPPIITPTLGVVLMLLHAYGLSYEALGLLTVVVLLMLIFFLRFSSGTGYVMALTPLSFAFGIPVMLPVGSGLLCSSAAAIPAACGTVLYYFIRFLRTRVEFLQSPDITWVEKLQVLADGMIQDWGMWITVVAFIAVIVIVHFIRTRSVNYAWRIAIVIGGMVYIAVMLTGIYFLEATVDQAYLVGSTVVAILVGLVLEFLFFGGDYSRTERVEYEDDEYYYYVKAVPKAVVAREDRQVKKIGGEPRREARRRREGTYSEDYQEEDEEWQRNRELERKLEESLREL